MEIVTQCICLLHNVKTKYENRERKKKKEGIFPNIQNFGYQF